MRGMTMLCGALLVCLSGSGVASDVPLLVEPSSSLGEVTPGVGDKILEGLFAEFKATYQRQLDAKDDVIQHKDDVIRGLVDVNENLGKVIRNQGEEIQRLKGKLAAAQSPAAVSLQQTPPQAATAVSVPNIPIPAPATVPEISFDDFKALQNAGAAGVNNVGAKPQLPAAKPGPKPSPTNPKVRSAANSQAVLPQPPASSSQEWINNQYFPRDRVAIGVAPN